MANVKIGSKVKIIDKKSSYHNKVCEVQKLLIQQSLVGEDELSSVICNVDGILVEFKVKQIEVTND